MKRVAYWLLVAGAVVMVLRLLWPVLLLAAVSWVVLRVVSARRAARVALCARADEQHAAVLCGDPAGIYGRFPPAVVV